MGELAGIAWAKPLALALYFVVGGVFLWTAESTNRARRTVAVPTLPLLTLLFVCAALLAVRYLIAGAWMLFVCAAVGTTIALGKTSSSWGRRALDAGAVLLLILSLAWWEISDPSGGRLVVVLGFAIIFAIVCRGLTDSASPVLPSSTIPLAIFTLLGLFLLTDLGSYRAGEGNLTLLAHHWGAYIGPAQHVLAGLIPFYDVPLQYGLGPTALIAATCVKGNCWAGAEAIIVAADLLSAVMLARMALTTSRPRTVIWRLTVSLVMFCALFLWPGDPAFGNWLLAAPSSSGMRVLPVCLVAYLLFFNRPKFAALALSLGVLWSPESAGMAIAVYGLCETARLGFVMAALRTGSILVTTAACLILIHRAIFGVWIEPAAFFEYVLHVPGPLPIDPVSDALVLGGGLILGGLLLTRPTSNPEQLGRDRVATSLLFAVGTFWLGRSHPNNICNIMPFLMLISLRVLDRSGQEAPVRTDLVMIAVAASVAALTLSPWHSVPFDARLRFDVRALVAEIPSAEPGIAQVRQQMDNRSGLGVADFGVTMVRNPKESIVWTPMDPSSLWDFVPEERRKLYIRRSASRLRRSGWAIFDATQTSRLADLLAGYDVGDEQQIDAPRSLIQGRGNTKYLVACLSPRRDIVKADFGPACPGHLR